MLRLIEFVVEMGLQTVVGLKGLILEMRIFYSTFTVLASLIATPALEYF